MQFLQFLPTWGLDAIKTLFDELFEDFESILLHFGNIRDMNKYFNGNFSPKIHTLCYVLTDISRYVLGRSKFCYKMMCMQSSIESVDKFAS